jgi:hypothetical protein
MYRECCLRTDEKRKDSLMVGLISHEEVEWNLVCKVESCDWCVVIGSILAVSNTADKRLLVNRYGHMAMTMFVLS